MSGPTPAPRALALRRKVRFGTIHADIVTFAEAIEAIAALVHGGHGGYVVTPNVDHVCLAETHLGLRAAYSDAALSLTDGMPLLWLARMVGVPVPEKISGSDLAMPLLRRAAAEGWRVYFLGGRDGIGARARDVLLREIPKLQVVGIASPPLGFERDPAASRRVLADLAAAQPQIVLVALGCPKQEVWMQQNLRQYAPAVALGIGATLDFIAGEVRRAPAWMSRCGLEWVYRLFQEPGRMAQRYLVRDRAIVGIAWRMLRAPRGDRAFFG